MKVVSGYMGAETVHFEAPPPEQVKGEIFRFIDWFNASLGSEDGLLRAAGAHLKLVTIHPYDDGNGRLSRALTDMAMAQDENTLFRSYSLSAEIMKERAAYYQILEDVQNQRADLIEWYKWFLSMFINAVKNSQHLIADAFYKAAFWNRIKTIALNERQRKVIRKMLDSGIRGFEGGMTTRKYVGMTKTSAATAYRELDDMNRKGVLRQFGAGRSVRYELNTESLDPGANFD
ncbi:hypothetical protein AGMMS49940_08340 [Spirochaetia bacterium]|nr:hypothetical protein AGMMS49940_08340 [Spirochaetia bacterium]